MGRNRRGGESRCRGFDLGMRTGGGAGNDAVHAVAEIACGCVDEARGYVLPVAPSDLLEAGVGVGIEPSISGAEESLRVAFGQLGCIDSLLCTAELAELEELRDTVALGCTLG
jgi:hypothetical protein